MLSSPESAITLVKDTQILISLASLIDKETKTIEKYKKIYT